MGVDFYLKVCFQVRGRPMPSWTWTAATTTASKTTVAPTCQPRRGHHPGATSPRRPRTRGRYSRPRLMDISFHLEIGSHLEIGFQLEISFRGEIIVHWEISLRLEIRFQEVSFYLEINFQRDIRCQSEAKP